MWKSARVDYEETRTNEQKQVTQSRICSTSLNYEKANQGGNTEKIKKIHRENYTGKLQPEKSVTKSKCRQMIKLTDEQGNEIRDIKTML